MGGIRSCPALGVVKAEEGEDMKNKLPIKRKQEIGGRLREVRKSLGLLQWELGNGVGLSQAMVSQYEKGLTEISLSFLEYLNKKHSVSSDWVLFGTGKMTNKELKRKKKR